MCTWQCSDLVLEIQCPPRLPSLWYGIESGDRIVSTNIVSQKLCSHLRTAYNEVRTQYTGATGSGQSFPASARSVQASA